MPLNTKAAGKIYPPSLPFEITDRDSMFYALAYNEDNEYYFDKREIGFAIIPPMFAVRYMGESVMEVLKDEEIGFNYEMMLHYAQEFEWFGPVKTGDKIISKAKVHAIEARKFGGILQCEVVAYNQEDELVTKSIWSFLDKSAASPECSGPDRPAKIAGEPLYTQEMKVRKGQTWIYAEASGDSNPIHISDMAARKAGLDGVILHGLCTMAFAHKVCVDNLTGDDKDPMKIKKLSLKFARPVKPGDTVTFKLYKTEEEQSGSRFNIAALNPGGKNILQDAWCIVAK